MGVILIYNNKKINDYDNVILDFGSIWNDFHIGMGGNF
jgi:hypothetical protein